MVVVAGPPNQIIPHQNAGILAHLLGKIICICTHSLCNCNAITHRLNERIRRQEELGGLDRISMRGYEASRLTNTFLKVPPPACATMIKPRDACYGVCSLRRRRALCTGLPTRERRGQVAHP